MLTTSVPETPATGLPAPLDSETMALMRGFLTPILENASSWGDLDARLKTRGYAVAFRHGRFVVCDRTTGDALCTGRSLGLPMRQLVDRIGRPRVRACALGYTGQLKN